MTRLNVEELDRTVFISDNLPFLKSLDNESVDLVVIDPPFSKNQTFVGNLKPPLTDTEYRLERELMDAWRVFDPATAYELGIEYPDQTGTTAKFEDIWNFGRRVFQDDLDELKNTHPAAWWLIHSTRYTHSDGTAAYIFFMVQRMVEIKRVLKNTGSVYLHCDHSANAYLRQMMDAIFGSSQFRNEIVWQRTESHNTPDRYGNIADIILYYTKSDEFIWNQQFHNYSEAQLKRFRQKDSDGRRYRLDDLTAPRPDSNSGKFEWRGTMPSSTRGWGYKLEQLEQWWREGRIHVKRDGTPRMDGLKKYLDESEGKVLQNIWTDVPRIPNTSAERTGYPTQKPQALAKRIIEASSNPGDIVLDCFAGCAYVPVAAELSDRRWIACDMSPRAWTVVRRQFHKQPDLRIVTEGELDKYGVEVTFDNRDKVIRVRGPHDLPKRVTENVPIKILIDELPDPQFRQKTLESYDQIWQAFVNEWGTACWYCGTEKSEDKRELQLDHIEPNTKDGRNDDCFNRALACAPCNSDKSNNLTVKKTIDKAMEAGRIATTALRDEQFSRFTDRHEWAKRRWEDIKPSKPQSIDVSGDADNSEPFMVSITLE